MVTKFEDLPEPLKSELSKVALSVVGQAGSGAKSQLNAMLSTGVSAPCRDAFAGRYPFFSNNESEATIADFGKFFSPNGVFDGFFQNNLRDLIDTARVDWQQLSGDNASFSLSSETISQFQSAAKIRDAFFPLGGTQPKVQFDLRPISLDPSVASFTLNIEGQEISYQHGPEKISSLQWPGPEPGDGVQIVFRLLNGQEVRSSKHGTWAFFRLLDDMQTRSTGMADRFQVTFHVGGHQVAYELRASSVQNPFNLRALHTFRCPEGL